MFKRKIIATYAPIYVHRIIKFKNSMYTITFHVSVRLTSRVVSLYDIIKYVRMI